MRRALSLSEPSLGALRKGKEVTEMWLAQQLRVYGVRPKTMWIGETAAKGCLEEDFVEAFRRHVPKPTMLEWLEEIRAGQRPRKSEGEPAHGRNGEAVGPNAPG